MNDEDILEMDTAYHVRRRSDVSDNTDDSDSVPSNCSLYDDMYDDDDKVPLKNDVIQDDGDLENEGEELPSPPFAWQSYNESSFNGNDISSRSDCGCNESVEDHHKKLITPEKTTTSDTSENNGIHEPSPSPPSVWQCNESSCNSNDMSCKSACGHRSSSTEDNHTNLCNNEKLTVAIPSEEDYPDMICEKTLRKQTIKIRRLFTMTNMTSFPVYFLIKNYELNPLDAECANSLAPGGIAYFITTFSYIYVSASLNGKLDDIESTIWLNRRIECLHNKVTHLTVANRHLSSFFKSNEND